MLMGAALHAQDWHLTSDPAASLYRISPLAHGYIHGYEDGFHAASYDLVTGAKEKRPGTANGAHDYKDGFGDRGAFLQGYTAGFDDGVADAQANGFRAEMRLRALADGVGAYDKGAAALFGEGLEAGYTRQRSGKADKLVTCAGPQAAQHPEFCEGYRRGALFAQIGAPGKTSANETAAEVPTTGGVTGVAVHAAEQTPKTSEVGDTDDEPAVPLPAANTGDLVLSPAQQPF